MPAAYNLDFNKYNYCIRSPHDSSDAYLDHATVSVGERYGGRGVGLNGGGVRCGLIGPIQVKGIGQNPLVGRNSDFWHSHGGANLEEALREVIWGDICYFALPFKSVRTLGIIATGTNTYLKSALGPVAVPRALILREASIRPAHFMRAVNYDPTDEVWANYAPDSHRTRLAVHDIDLALNSLVNKAPIVRHDPDLINRGLLLMVKRFANQIAAARAKRIPHGSLNCSNICLDGRYVDFGTMTAISDFGRIIVSGGNPDLWHEETALFETIDNLLFYIQKYLPSSSNLKYISPGYLKEAFGSELTERLRIEFVKLTGIPEDSILEISPPVVNCVWLEMMALIAAENDEPFKMVDTADVVHGSYHLPSIMTASSLCGTSTELEIGLRKLIPMAERREKWVSAYLSLREAYRSKYVCRSDFCSVFLAINAIRINADLRLLSRYQFARDSAELISENCSTIERFIKYRIDVAKLILSDCPKKGLCISVGASRQIVFSPDGISGKFPHGSGIADSIMQLPSEIFTSELKMKIVALCS